MAFILTQEEIEELADQMAAIALQTELSGNTAKILQFSYAGADSSYSFGIKQFDVAKRQDARDFLASIGFSAAEISQLSQHGGLSSATVAGFNARLAAHSTELATFTRNSLYENVARMQWLINDLLTRGGRSTQIALDLINDRGLLLTVFDYDNQFNISGIGGGKAGAMLTLLRNGQVGAPGGTTTLDTTAEGRSKLYSTTVFDFITRTQYGMEHRGSIERRLFALSSTLGTMFPGYAQGPNMPTAPTAPETPRTATVLVSDLYFTDLGIYQAGDFPIGQGGSSGGGGGGGGYVGGGYGGFGGGGGGGGTVTVTPPREVEQPGQPGEETNSIIPSASLQAANSLVSALATFDSTAPALHARVDEMTSSRIPQVVMSSQVQ